MTRPTVSKRDVAAALDEFRRQGLPQPGLHRLRQAIGRGSLARIKRLQAELALERGERLTPEALAKVPDPISEAAARLWAELEAANDALQAGIEAQLKQAEQAMAEERTQRDAALAGKAAELEQAAGELQTLTARLDATDAARMEATGALDAAKTDVARLHAELHASARSAEERQSELLRELESERTARKTDASEAAKRITELEKALEKEKADSARAREVYLTESSYAQAKSEADERAIAVLNERLTENTRNMTELQQKADSLQAKLDQVREEASKEREKSAVYVARLQSETKALSRERDDFADLVSSLRSEKARLLEKTRKLEADVTQAEIERKLTEQRLADLTLRLKSTTKPPAKRR